MTTPDDKRASNKKTDQIRCNSSLGQPTDYQEIYDPQILHIARADYRSTIDDFV